MRVLAAQGSAISRIRNRVELYVELSKPRITALAVVASAIGFQLGASSQPLVAVGLWEFAAALLGTALICAGANALNQFLEIPWDRMMQRTAGRPLPSRRLRPEDALRFAVATSIVGLALLLAVSRPLAATLGAISILNYVFVYTPLKRVTPLCVFVGAVSGAAPPMIGWVTASGSLQLGAWLMYAVVFFWQLPHFASISWMYRDDYARAGYRMLAVVDEGGVRLDLHLATYTVVLIFVSVLPVFYGVAGAVYGLSALGLGLAFLACGAYFIWRKTLAVARFHVLASVVYLPLVLAGLMLDGMLTP